MRSILLLVFALLSLAVQSAQADVLVRDYERLREDPNIHSYLVGFSRGVFYTNSFVGVAGQRRLFCPPRSLQLDEDVLLSVIDSYIKASKPKSDEFVEQLILDAFVKEYPCLH